MTDPADPGDYGYDMAHEDRVRDATEGGREAGHRPPTPSPQRAADRPEADGDFGYDEAHGF